MSVEEGRSSGLVRREFERHPRAFPEMDEDGHLREADEKKMVEHYAKERGLRWEWQSMDSKKSCAAPLGGEKTAKNPTDRGKLGAKIHLLVDQRGAPLNVVLTGANRHDKIAAIELIVSVAKKRPAHKEEQHLCADKAYDATDVREFVASAGYTPHIKVNPARRWVVERTISWLNKRRGVRTRWSKKAENWLALVQLTCAHVLLNLAVLG